MIYLDNAATTFPKPENVYQKVDWANRNLAVNAGRGSYKVARQATKLIDETRDMLVKLVHGVGVENVILTPSATIALHMVLQGLDLKKGDTVYVSPYEHNAVARTLQKIADEKEIMIKELPICPEFVLCGVDPTEKKRKKEVNWGDDPQSLDTKFDFTKHNFLSRGGELYYLHLLQGLDGDKNRQDKLEHLLNDLVNGQCQKISKLANYVQESWEEQYSLDKTALSQKLEVAYIPATGYKVCGRSKLIYETAYMKKDESLWKRHQIVLIRNQYMKDL